MLLSQHAGVHVQGELNSYAEVLHLILIVDVDTEECFADPCVIMNVSYSMASFS